MNKRTLKKTGIIMMLVMAFSAVFASRSVMASGANQEMQLGTQDSIVWHSKGTGGGGQDEVTRIGLVRRDTYRYQEMPVYDILLGYENSSRGNVQTSFFNGGYGSAAALGTDFSLINGTALKASESSAIGSGVSVDMKYTGLADSTIIKVDYIINNTGSSTQKVYVGGTVDTCIALDDYANIKPFDSQLINGMKGLVSMARSGEFLGFAMEDGDYWYGQWTPLQSAGTYMTYIAKAGTEESLSNSESSYDSCMSYKWIANVPAGGTVTKSCYIGVGDTKLGDSPSMMETIGKYRVDLYADADDNGNVPAYLVADPGDSVTLPVPVRSGYTFSGWYTQAAGGTLVGAGGASYTPAGDIGLYGCWTPIVNTVNVSMTLNDDAWKYQNVRLVSDSGTYTLTDDSTGTYSSNEVINGRYKIMVNGEKTEQSVEVSATDAPVTKNVSMAYKRISVATRLDGTETNAFEEVSIRRSDVYHQSLKYDGTTHAWIRDIPVSSFGNLSYDIYVGGNDTGYKVTSSDLSHTIDYYTMTVNITNSAAWTDARVTLRENDNKVAALLPYKSADGNTAIYSLVMQGDTDATPAEYKVFVGNTDTHKTVKRTSANKSADVTFYPVNLVVNCSALPDTVSASLSNGVDSYVFEKGNTISGTRTPFTVRVLHNDEHPAYTAVLNGVGTAGTSAVTFDTGNKTREINVYVMTYNKYTNDSGGTEVYGKDYVLGGGHTTAPVGPALAGYTFDGWSASAWDKSEVSFTAFDFSQPVTEDKTIYAHYYPATVQINGYLRTDSDGTANPSGTSYRMPNLTIYGFESGNVIKYILYEGTNISKIKAVGTLPSGTSFNETTGLLTFGNPVSMKTAQNTVRDHIVVTPEAGEESTMVVKVYSNN